MNTRNNFGRPVDAATTGTRTDQPSLNGLRSGAQVTKQRDKIANSGRNGSRGEVCCMGKRFKSWDRGGRLRRALSVSGLSPLPHCKLRIESLTDPVRGSAAARDPKTNWCSHRTPAIHHLEIAMRRASESALLETLPIRRLCQPR